MSESQPFICEKIMAHIKLKCILMNGIRKIISSRIRDFVHDKKNAFTFMFNLIADTKKNKMSSGTNFDAAVSKNRSDSQYLSD